MRNIKNCYIKARSYKLEEHMDAGAIKEIETLIQYSCLKNTGNLNRSS